MLKLNNITLIALSGLDYQTKENIHALNESCKGIEWGAVKYIQQGDIIDINSWNKAVIYDLHKYIDTDFAMFVHGDAEITHPELWDNEWLKLDYIGSPWPLPNDEFSYRTSSGRLIRVGNSVSLRSKRLMELIATRPMEYHYGNNNEDGQICVWERDWLESQGCKFATFEQALKFGKEHELPENRGVDTFLVHEVG